MKNINNYVGSCQNLSVYYIARIFGVGGIFSTILILMHIKISLFVVVRSDLFETICRGVTNCRIY